MCERYMVLTLCCTAASRVACNYVCHTLHCSSLSKAQSSYFRRKHQLAKPSLYGSRLHWALLQKDNVVEAWDTGHLGREGPPGKVDGKDPGGSIVDEEGIPLSFLSVKAQEMLRGEAVGKVSCMIRR